MAAKPSITKNGWAQQNSTLRKRQALFGGAFSASTDRVFTFPHSAVRIVGAGMVTSTNDAIDGTNYWSVQLVDKGTDGTETVNLLSAAATNTTGGTAITAYDDWLVTPNQNQELEKGSVLIFEVTKVASATALADVTVWVEYQENF
jgi:hypothetical protein